MPRYIDREKFLKKCVKVFGYMGVTIKAIEGVVDECTIDDVAPKSEVAREIFEEIEKHLIFNAYGIATISDKTFAELKKKYIGIKRECHKCRYFVGCEKAVWVGMCDEYEGK
jgi:hypothetical protein